MAVNQGLTSRLVRGSVVGSTIAASLNCLCLRVIVMPFPSHLKSIKMYDTPNTNAHALMPMATSKTWE